MTVLVLFGLDAEWAAWRRHHAFRRAHAIGGLVYETRIGQALVRTAVVGMGATRLPDMSEIWRAGVDVAVVCGLAGSLRPECPRGDVIVASEVRARRPRTSIPTAPGLVTTAVGCGARRVQSLLSVDRVVASAAEKALLASLGDAVDMESFTVLGEAARYGVPGAAIRVIGDAADEDLPIDFDGTFRSDGTIDAARLLLAIAARPRKWLALVPFAFRQRRALARLAVFLDRFIAVLGVRS